MAELKTVKKVGRRAATIANLSYQYISICFILINGILIVPLYLKYIDINLYGVWLATGNIVTWLLIADVGLSDLIRQQAAKACGSGNLDNTGKVIGTGLLLTALIGLIPALVGLILSPMIPVLFELTDIEGEAISVAFLLASVSSSLIIIGGGAGSAQQGLQKNVSFTVVYVLSSILGLLCSITMLVKGYSIFAIPCGFLVQGWISTVAYWGILIHICRKAGIRLVFSRGAVAKFSSLLAWTSINRFAYQLFFNCDAFIVGVLLGAKATTVYMLSRRAWYLLNLFTNRLGVAFMPGLAHLYGDGQTKLFKSITLRLFETAGWILAIGVGGCLCFNHSFISLWVGSEFYAGDLFNILMAMAMVIQILTFIANKVLYGAEDIKWPSIMGTVVYLAKAVFLVGLIWGVGLIGGPLSIIVAFGFVGGWFFVGRLRKVIGLSSSELWGYVGKLCRGLGVAFLFSVLFRWLFLPGSWGMFTVGIASYVVAVCVTLIVVDHSFRAQVSTLVFDKSTKLVTRYNRQT